MHRISGVLFTAWLLVLSGCADQVNLLNTAAGEERGLLVDAANSTTDVNDLTFVTAGTPVNVGQLQLGTANNEILGFTNKRPVAILDNAPWTSSQDSLDLSFSPKIVIPVKVWIVKGPFDTQRAKAIDACVTTSAIWNSERMGVSFGPFEIVDATGDAQAANYHTFTCAKRAGIESDIGKTNGRINIYYVDTVDGGTGRGQACQIGSDFVAMGKNTGDELLSHELGHDFALTHIDGLTTDFNQTNVMHSASNSRQYLTEGQLARGHLDGDSALNFLYNARPGQPTRDCSLNQISATCVDIKKRIWADGAFPAN